MPLFHPSGKVAPLLGLFLMLLARTGLATPEGRAGFSVSHLPPALTASRPTGRHDGAKRLALDLVLPLRRRPALDDLLRRLYDPQDPLFGHYLTPAQLAARFGPAQADVDAVSAFARAHGLAVEKIADNRTVVQVSGPARAVEDAFAVQINDYRDETGRPFFGPDREPTVAPDVAGRLLGVLGLSNAGKPRAFSRPAPVSEEIAGSGLLNYATGLGGLSPVDVQNIYGLAGVPDKGTGQVAGLFELGTYTAGDIPAYFTQYHLPAIPVNTVSVDSYDTTSAPGDASAEVTLDIDMIAALAPGVSQIRVYEATDQNTISFPQLLHDSFTAMANDPQGRPSVISVSYGFSELYAAPADFQTVEQATAILAAQGQSVCVASGDAGAYTYQDKSYGPNASFPATDPNVTCVGGTNLADGYNSAANSVYYQSETSWFDPSDTGRGAIGTGGGGGVSGHWGLPSWQVGAFNMSVNPQGSTTNRNVPDVSLFGDYDTGGYSIYYTPPAGSGNWYGYNGTSAASPLWAAFLADVDQARAAKGRAAIGLANPALYRAAEGPNYAADFHDIADGSSNGFYNAVAGYDNSTGWGSFNGGNLLNDLVPASASPTVVSVTNATGNPGQTVTLTASLDYGGAISPLTGRTLNFQVDGVSAGSGTTDSNGTASVAYTIPTNFAPGPHTIAVSFSGDSGDGASSRNGTLSVVAATAAGTSVGVAAAAGAPGQTIALTGTLTNATTQAGVANETLSFTVNGAAAGTATTNASGVASIIYTIPVTLSPGGYPIVVAFAGDTTLNSSRGTGTLTVTPALVNTAVSVANTNGAGGQTLALLAALTASGTPIANETLTFTVNGLVAGTAITDGTGVANASYTVPANLAPGNYTIAVAFAGDNVNGPSSGSGTLTVTAPKINTTITTSNVSGTSGQAVTLSATLTNTVSGSPIANEPCGFFVNGATAGTATTNASGVASVTYTIPTTLSPSSYTLIADFSGDNSYNSTSVVGTLTVNRVTTALSAANASGNDGRTVTLSATLTTAADGSPLADRSVTFSSLLGVVQATTNASGVAYATYLLPGTFQTGKYPVTVTFAGDNVYGPSNGNGTLTVIPAEINTAIVVNSPAGVYGQTVTLTGKLTNTQTQAAVAGETLTFSVDGDTVGTAATNSTGTAAMPYALPGSLSLGGHTLTVTFAGDNSYYPGSGTGTLKVSLAPASLSVPGVSGVYGQTVALNATLTNATSHGALADETLTFSVDGAAVGTAATSVKGLGTVSFTLPTTLAVGSHTLTVSFGGDAYHNPGSGTGTLKVSKVIPSLSVPSLFGAAGQTLNLSGTLTNPATHAALANETLSFTVNGAAAGTATTNASGVATLPYTIPITLVGGKYSLLVAFAGDSVNNSASKTGTLTVNKVNTALAVPGVTGTVGQTVTLSATLTAGGTPLANQTLSFVIDTTAIGTAATYAPGVASETYTIPATLAAGKHTIKVTFAGDGNNNASTGTATLTRN